MTKIKLTMSSRGVQMSRTDMPMGLGLWTLTFDQFLDFATEVGEIAHNLAGEEELEVDMPEKGDMILVNETVKNVVDLGDGLRAIGLEDGSIFLPKGSVTIRRPIQ